MARGEVLAETKDGRGYGAGTGASCLNDDWQKCDLSSFLQCRIDRAKLLLGRISTPERSLRTASYNAVAHYIVRRAVCI